jgi:hypothetical protein
MTTASWPDGARLERVLTDTFADTLAFLSRITMQPRSSVDP